MEADICDPSAIRIKISEKHLHLIFVIVFYTLSLHLNFEHLFSQSILACN